MLALLMEPRDVAYWANDVVFVVWPPGPPIKQLIEFNEQYSVNCEALYFVLRLFPFKSFYEENGFYVFKCNIS